MQNLKILTMEEAKLILDEASKLNPGPWVEHSLNVAEAAKSIADNDKDLDGEVAYILGMLHDIGRRYGVTSMRHIIDGYNFLIEKGYDLAARISITHSFTYKNINSICGEWDCSDEELSFVESYINGIEFDSYDKLIQLCDAVALPNGCCLMEKRIVDVVMRYGFNEFTLDKWKASFEIQKYFEDRIGKSIYDVIPNVKEFTFKMDI